MADIVPSLFGIDPETLKQQRFAQAQEQARLFAQMSPNEQVSYGGYMAGSHLGTGLGSLMGAQDPELQKLTAMRKAAEGADITTSEGLMQVARNLMQSHPNEAMAIKARADALKTEELTRGKLSAEAARMQAQAEAAKRGYGKINPQMYTPESLAKFKESGDFADLEINPKAVSIKAQSPAGKVAADRGFTPGTPEFAAEVRKVEEEMAKASAEKIKAKSQMPAAIVKQVDELQSHVDTFSNNIQDIDSLVKLMDENKVKFSPGDNFESFLRTVFNNSDEAARVKSDLRTTVEGMRNAILQGNKGTQTEGDAERAASEILSALDKNDTATVYRRLTVLKTKFERAMAQRKSRMDNLLGMYGQGQKPPAEEPQTSAPAPAAPSGPTFSLKDKINDPASVKKAFKEGKISREQAKIILKDLGM